MKDLSLATPPEKKDSKSAADNAYAKAGLMRGSDLKIGGLDMNGNEIKSKKDLARARADLQAAQKALKAGGAPPPPKGKPTPAAPEETKTPVPIADLKISKVPAPSPVSATSPPIATPTPGADAPEPAAKSQGKKSRTTVPKRLVRRQEQTKVVPIFSHLEQGKADIPSLLSYIDAQTSTGKPDAPVLHPAFLQLGLDYASGVITGSSARCIAFLQAFRSFVEDYTPANSGDVIRDMPLHVKAAARYLDDCRALCLPLESMLNRCNELMVTACRTHALISDIKNSLRVALEEWIALIAATQNAIVDSAVGRIDDGDVILTYARSQVVENVLVAAHKEGKTFKVIVVDSRPHTEGKKVLERIVPLGIQCEYANISAVNYVMRRVTKVLLGAHAMMANGTLLARAGTAIVAMTAKTLNKPVIVCCETFKFSKRVQLDALAYNELGAPQALLAPGKDRTGLRPNLSMSAPATGISALSKADSGVQSNLVTEEQYMSLDSLKLLNVVYDLTPTQFISAIVTEFGFMPPTSASVIVREAPMGVKKSRQ